MLKKLRADLAIVEKLFFPLQKLKLKFDKKRFELRVGRPDLGHTSLYDFYFPT